MERYELLRQYMTDIIKSLKRQNDIAKEMSNSVADMSTLQLHDDAGEDTEVPSRGVIHTADI